MCSRKRKFSEITDIVTNDNGEKMVTKKFKKSKSDELSNVIKNSEIIVGLNICFSPIVQYITEYALGTVKGVAILKTSMKEGYVSCKKKEIKEKILIISFMTNIMGIIFVMSVWNNVQHVICAMEESHILHCIKAAVHYV